MTLSLDEIIRTRDHGVSTSFIYELKKQRERVEVAPAFAEALADVPPRLEPATTR